VRITNPRAFAPGATDAGDDSSPTERAEIEFEIDLGPERRDLLNLRGGYEDSWRYGSDGLDTDAPDKRDAAGDVEIRVRGAERHLASLGVGDDSFSAMGGAGTGEPFSGDLVVEGSFGSDVLAGSPGSDLLYASYGEDELFGRGGADRIVGGDEADLLSGGPGNDSASWPYSGANSQIRVDIGAGGANDGAARDQHGDRVLSDIENLFGGGGDDVLIGDDGPNVLVGGDRSDRLLGLGADDVLIDYRGLENAGDVFRAGRGRDLLIAHDEFRDRTIECGQGFDHLFADRMDSDGSRCEDREYEEGPARWIAFGALFLSVWS
jgi:Ca2+-binding RTX toxin-like protein